MVHGCEGREKGERPIPCGRGMRRLVMPIEACG